MWPLRRFPLHDCFRSATKSTASLSSTFERRTKPSDSELRSGLPLLHIIWTPARTNGRTDGDALITSRRSVSSNLTPAEARLALVPAIIRLAPVCLSAGGRSPSNNGRLATVSAASRLESPPHARLLLCSTGGFGVDDGGDRRPRITASRSSCAQLRRSVERAAVVYRGQNQYRTSAHDDPETQHCIHEVQSLTSLS